MKKIICFLKVTLGQNYFSFPTLGNRIFQAVLFVVFCVYSVQISHAQNVKDYNSVLNALRSSSDESVSAKAVQLNSLIYDLQPKLYIHKDNMKNCSETFPVCIAADANSLDFLYEANPLFEKVELITVNLNSADDLNFVLDFSKLKSFTNLTYIQFMCRFRCDPSLIRINGQKPETGIIVFYQISIPE